MKDELGERIKTHYEDRFRYKLPRRAYTIMRVDGKEFHTYTRGLERPFDDGLINDMNVTAAYLCKNLSEKDKLFKDWQQARDNFMMYAMKALYGDIRDREYNTEQANNWNKIISDLRVKIINTNQK